MPTYLRQDQATISVFVWNPATGLPAQLPWVKSWASIKGGDVDAATVASRPGGILGEINLGGPSSRSDVTVSRPYTSELHPFISRLDSWAGTTAMVVSYAMLNYKRKDFSHNRAIQWEVTGPTVTVNGILKSVVRPEYDAEVEGVAMFSLVMACFVESSESKSSESIF